MFSMETDMLNSTDFSGSNRKLIITTALVSISGLIAIQLILGLFLYICIKCIRYRAAKRRLKLHYSTLINDIKDPLLMNENDKTDDEHFQELEDEWAKHKALHSSRYAAALEGADLSPNFPNF